MLIGEDRFYLETITRPRGLTVVRSLVRDPRKPCFESKPVMLLGKVYSLVNWFRRGDHGIVDNGNNEDEEESV